MHCTIVVLRIILHVAFFLSIKKLCFFLQQLINSSANLTKKIWDGGEFWVFGLNNAPKVEGWLACVWESSETLNLATLSYLWRWLVCTLCICCNILWHYDFRRLKHVNIISPNTYLTGKTFCLRDFKTNLLPIITE